MTRSHLASQRAVLDTRERHHTQPPSGRVLAGLLALALLRASPVLAAGVVGTGTPASCTEDALDTALDGGGLVTFNCGPDPVTITITSTKTISADTTIDGGGTVTVSGGDAVGVFSVDSGIRFTVQYLTVAHGSTTTGSGGGILNGNGIVAVTNSTFSGNSTIRCAPVVGCGGQPGGAIYNGGTLTVANSTFSGNTAGGGGGISNSGALTVTNSTFSDNGNVSSGRGIPGGGIGNSGTATVINSTFSGNHPGDIYSHTVSSYTAALTLANSILYSCVSYAGTVTDGGHNLIGIATSSCGQTDGVNGNIVGFDPGLDPAGLKDNGGPTQTIALQPDSRAINAGDQAVCAAPPVNNLDQRGYIRPGAGATNCSIGAFEANALPPCAGDCNGNAQVTVDEILTLVNIALGNTPMTDCSAGDTNHDNQITVDEILAAVNNALNGCPPLPTPLPTQTPTMTSTATVTPTGPPAATTTPTTAATATATAVPPTPTGTPTWTPTLTPTPTQTPTATNTPRFVDNGDGTITDGQTQLVWEKKSDDDSLHDKDSYYSWAGTCSVGGAYCQPSAAAADACAAGTGSTSTVGCAQCPSGETCNCASAACNTNGANPVPGSGNNSTIWQWLVWLNSGSGFAGATDWRIPTINAANYGDATGAPAATELETILRAAFPCEGFNPCAWPAFNTGCTAGCTVTTCSCTQSSYYWSATSFGGAPMNAWAVYFANGHVDFTNRSSNYYVRAVRGGS